MIKKIFIAILIVFVIVVVYYFQKPPNPVGLFVAKNNVNTIDSLWVLEGGGYERSIYNAQNNELLFRSKGEWIYENERLLLKDFFPNDDEPLKKGYAFNSVLMTFSVPLEKSFGREVFDYNETTATFRFYRPYY